MNQPKKYDLNNLSEWTPKKLRTLRNNLNNRLESFKKDSENPKELQASHILHGLSYKECQELLTKVKSVLSKESL